MTIFVFVYGSLKKGFGNHGCLGQSPFLKEDVLKNAFLVNLGAFPGMFKAPSDLPNQQVHGEVYEISTGILARLDMLEGHPNFYRREMVTLASGLEAWSYFLNEQYRQERYKVCNNGMWHANR